MALFRTFKILLDLMWKRRQFRAFVCSDIWPQAQGIAAEGIPCSSYEHSIEKLFGLTSLRMIWRYLGVWICYFIKTGADILIFELEINPLTQWSYILQDYKRFNFHGCFSCHAQRHTIVNLCQYLTYSLWRPFMAKNLGNASCSLLQQI